MVKKLVQKEILKPAKKEKGGHYPVGLDLAQIKKMEEIAPSMTMPQIADYFSIDEKTFKRIRERQPEVESAYKRARTKGLEKATGKLWEHINNDDKASLIFYLKTQWGWKEKQDINLSNEDGSMQSAPPVIISFADNEK